MSEIHTGFIRLCCAAAAALLMTPHVTFGASPASFERHDYKVGSRPGAIAVADLNSDTLPDIAVLNSRNMSILYGSGAGAFLKARALGTGRAPENLVTGDFNKDSRTDVAVLALKGVRIICGASDGKMKHRMTVGMKYAFLGLASADFDRDGVADLAAGRIRFYGGPWGVDHVEYYVRVLGGVGDGRFTMTQDYRVGKMPTAILANDFNGDGIVDLAVATSANGGDIEILYGLASGGFAEAVACATPAADALVSGDFNRDGLLDIALVSAKAGAVAVLYGRLGGFESPVTYPVTDVSGRITAGDLNGDGLADIAVCRGRKEGFVTVLYGQESGGFGAVTDYAVGSWPSGIATADLNGDSRLDIVASNNRSKNVSVLLNTGNQP
jgi:hypothetical protein